MFDVESILELVLFLFVKDLVNFNFISIALLITTIIVQCASKYFVCLCSGKTTNF